MADILLTDDFTKTQVHEDEILSKTFLNSAEKLTLNLGHFFFTCSKKFEDHNYFVQMVFEQLIRLGDFLHFKCLLS